MMMSARRHVGLSSLLLLACCSLVKAYMNVGGISVPLRSVQGKFHCEQRNAFMSKGERRTLLSMGLAETSFSGMTRKEKQRLKKAQKEEQLKQKTQIRNLEDGLIDQLFDEIDKEKRDVQAISSTIAKLRDVQPVSAASSQTLSGDWKLVYTDSASTLNTFGTGLGGLPGTSVKEMFVSFLEGGKVTVREICRIIGPFPNVRNQLDGTFLFQKRTAGFKGDAVEQEGLTLSYDQLTDGRDKVTTVKTGFKARQIVVDVSFVNFEALILSLNDGHLVFEKETAMEQEITKLLRRDLTKENAPPPSLIEGIAQVATGAKKPWDLFK